MCLERVHVHHRQHRRGVRLVQNPVLDQLLVVPEEQGALGDLEVVTGDAASDGVHEELRKEGEKSGRGKKDEENEEEDKREGGIVNIRAYSYSFTHHIRWHSIARAFTPKPTPSLTSRPPLAHLSLPPPLPQFPPPSLPPPFAPSRLPLRSPRTPRR